MRKYTNQLIPFGVALMLALVVNCAGDDKAGDDDLDPTADNNTANDNSNSASLDKTNDEKGNTATSAIADSATGTANQPDVGSTNAAAESPSTNSQGLNAKTDKPTNNTANQVATKNSTATLPPNPEPQITPPAPAAVPETTATVMGELWWVGYSYLARQREVRIDLVTKGAAAYGLSQERNHRGQPELVVSFKHATMRHKLKRSIDASEFRSPVAFIRVRPNVDAVDVVMTLRDNVQPRLFAKSGSVRLTFPIPDRYFGVVAQNTTAASTASLLPNARVMPILDNGSELPIGYKGGAAPDPAKQVFQSTPANAGDTVNVTNLPNSQVTDDPQTTVPVPVPAPAATKTEIQPANDQPDDSTPKSPPAKNSRKKKQDEDNGSNENTSQDENHKFEVRYLSSFALGAVAQDNGGGQAPSDIGSLDSQGGQGAGMPPTNPSNADQNPGPSLTQGTKDVVGQDAALQPQAPQGKLVRLDFRNAPLAEVLRTLSQESKSNIIFSPELGKTAVSITLRDVPWDEAFKAVLETNSLGVVNVGQNVIRIDRLDKLNSEKENLDKMRKSVQRLAPTKVLVMRLSYATAGAIKATVANMLASSLKVDDRIRIEGDERTNSLVVEALPNDLAKVKALVERLDMQTPQVEIASRIIESQQTFSDFFGISWGGMFNYDHGRGLGFGSLPFPNNFNSIYAIDPGLSGSRVGAANLRFGSINSAVDIDMVLKMEEKRGNVQILTSNRVVVQDNAKALISAGSTDYFKVAAPLIAGSGGTGGTQLEPVNYNLTLNVLPHITADGAVQMDISVDSATPAPASSTGADAARNTRTVNTKMLKSTGETAVIGGLYSTKKQKDIAGIPFLSRLPILGALFRSTTTTETQQELLIMITPTILNSAQVANASAPSSTAIDAMPASDAADTGDSGGDKGIRMDGEGNAAGVTKASDLNSDLGDANGASKSNNSGDDKNNNDSGNNSNRNNNNSNSNE